MKLYSGGATAEIKVVVPFFIRFEYNNFTTTNFYYSEPANNEIVKQESSNYANKQAKTKYISIKHYYYSHMRKSAQLFQHNIFRSKP